MAILEQLGQKIFTPAETGFLMARHLSNQFEKELVRQFRKIPSISQQTSLFALGGFGRREMCPLSDVDIMILIPENSDKSEFENGVKELLHPLWQDGLKIGHAVRTVSECMSMLDNDLITLTAFTDGRFIDGDRNLADNYSSGIQNYLKTNKSQNMLFELLQNYESNVQKSGGSVHLLEPNLKKSPGALRDVHFLGWLYLLISEGHPLFNFRSTDDETQSERVFLRLYKNGLIDETQYRHVYEATDFILKSRFALHLADKLCADQLSFNLQSKVAVALGFSGETEKDFTETFMKKYYLHARKIFRLSRTFHQRTMDFVKPPENDFSKVLDGGFHISHNRIYFGKSFSETVIESELVKSPHLMMMAFYYQSEYKLPFSDDLRGAIARSYELITEDFQSNPRVVYLFRQILQKPDSSQTLKNMLELGVLNRFIPEYGPLVGLYQRNAYHWYTADYHTLVAIEKLEKSIERWKPVYQVWQSMERPELLILSIFFHDIGKGFDIKKHEIVGMDVADQVMTRWGFEREEIELVRFMVKYHLTMEQTAFRRNYHDSETLDSFVRLLPNKEYLDVLYCLTYADLSAVNPNVWTEWKGMMLSELYNLSLRSLNSVEKISTQLVLEEAKKNKVASITEGDTDESVLAHIREFDSHTDYWLAFKPEEINQHVAFRNNENKVEVLITPFDGYLEITVMTNDQDGLLYKLCGIISSMDVSIFDARVFTAGDGLAIDRFRVFPLVEPFQSTAELKMELEKRLKKVLFENEQVGNWIDKFRSKWKRKFKPSAIFEPEISTVENQDQVMIEIYAPDTLGLLYCITRSFSELHLPIEQAKIATRVDGANDTFYVKKSILNSHSDLDKMKKTLSESISKFVNQAM